MAGMSLETIIYAVGLVLTLAAVVGVGVLGANELRVRSVRRTRLAAAGGAVAAGGGKAPGVLSGQVVSAVRRLGQQSAVKDPSKVPLLRSRLMQAGFYSREAPVVFLGVKAAALVIATAVVILTLPM